MPIDNFGRQWVRASAASLRKYGRVCSGSSLHGGMVIRPVRRRLRHLRIASMSSGNASGAATGFGFFLAQFHFDHHFEGRAGLIQPAGELFGVHGFDRLKQFRGNARLVALQVPD